MSELEQPIDQIAVLIDCENVGLTAIQTLFNRLSDYGRITLKRAYADWGNANNSRDQILELGIEAVHIFRSHSRGKNTCDIRLTIDAMELLHTSSVDAFVIVSSDSDFVPLVNKLRSSGKKVYVAGDKSKVIETLRISCNEYFEIEHSKNVQPVIKESGQKVKKKPNPLKNEGKSQSATKPQIDSIVAQQIDQAWSLRASTSGKSIPGPTAATDLVAILQIEKLKSSPYRTLQGVLGSSPLLTKHWTRNKNAIVRK